MHALASANAAAPQNLEAHTPATSSLAIQIRSIEPVASLACAPLQELYVAANKVTAITCLSALTQLTVLELGSNRIAKVEGLEAQGALRELWLGRNRIAAIEGVGHMTRLVRLSLQSNRWGGCGHLQMHLFARMRWCTGIRFLGLQQGLCCCVRQVNAHLSTWSCPLVPMRAGWPLCEASRAARLLRSCTCRTTGFKSLRASSP